MKRAHRRVALPVALTIGVLAGCSPSSPSTTSAATTTTQASSSATTSVVTTDNAVDHDDPADHEWDAADEVPVSLEGDTAATEGAGVVVDDSTVTITAPGTYRISGALAGQVVVDTADEGIVRLILDDAQITSPTTSAVAVTAAEEVVVVLADGTQNTLEDAAEYVDPDESTDEPNAALFSAADLTITGAGALSVTGAANDGIASKDGLVITGGTVTVDAVDDGIRGKDYLVVEGGTLTVTAGGDGLKSDNAEDATMGYVQLSAGTVSVIAEADGVDATTDAILTGAALTVVAGDGSDGTLAEDRSAKGVKGTVSVVVAGGTVDIDSADDALHSNGTVAVSDGVLTLTSSDDGVHADAELTVSGGTLTVTDAYEGLESAVIDISGGTVDLTASDDGLNVGGGAGGSGTRGPGRPGAAVRDGAATGAYSLTISGGTVVVDSGGDGLDSNGSITITGGTVVVNGPSAGMNGALDYDETFDISGGVLVAVGTASMAETPDQGSTQAWIGFGATLGAGSVVQIAAADGTLIASFELSKDSETFILSSPDLVAGESYTILEGGTVTSTIAGYGSTGDLTGATELGTTTAAGA